MVFRVFMVSGWFFIFHVENTLKLYSGPTIQSRPCRPKAGFGLVIMMMLIMRVMVMTIVMIMLH